jgi:xylan 1,4-beta-xylosidase
VNGGPLAAGGLLDTSARWKEAAFPLARLHDCHWPNPDVVDVHAIFPGPARQLRLRADRRVREGGPRLRGGIVYRLGESIEHQKAKRHVRPPKGPGRWAAVCAVAVRPARWGGRTGYEVRRVDADRALGLVGGGEADGCAVTVDLPAPSICLLTLWS